MAGEIIAFAGVHLWDRLVGAVTEDADGVITFEYDEAFRRSGWEVSPVHLPLSLRGPVVFPELRRQSAFEGLPGVLADSLPDRFGNVIIRRYFEDRGMPDRALSPVQKLLYIGTRAVGALEYRPPEQLPHRPGEDLPLEIAELVREARVVVEGRTEVAIPEMMRVGVSAGGMRPKAVVLWNAKSGELRSGHAAPRPGDEAWILKFDGVAPVGSDEPGEQVEQAPQPYMRVEHAVMELGRRAGLDVAETRQIRERDYAHLLVRRFDRENGGKLHQHTLGGLQHVDFNMPGAFSYEGLLRTVLRLELGHPALEEAYARMVFNVAVVNQDDHVKNTSFLLDPDRGWRLSPAYDLTYAQGTGWTRLHQMSVRGKREGIERADLEAVGREFGLRRNGAPIIERVTAALGEWEEVAADAGVPERAITGIRRAMRERGLANE
ncbi:MAG TPA: type II toxin-antitoxin system HipA family toxin [Longimicrobiales bacterium]|nr:type II toxin-antitoxin system HipA family toxin [Longimicrobiales bacterium]